jgi:spore coat polysaccharide biosynthesis protein SpsF
MFVVGIVQARMTSTRLPRKVLKTFPIVSDAGEVVERPNLAVMWARILASKTVDHWIVATTTDPEDEQICEWCRENDVAFSRGSTSDVLSRYAEAAMVAIAPAQRDAALIVRVTSDCPCIDPQEIDRLVNAFLKAQMDAGVEYATNSPFEDCKVGQGWAVEVMKASSLFRMASEATETYDREHVTPYLRRATAVPPPLFSSPDLDTFHLRATLDTPDDYQMLRVLLRSLTAKRASAEPVDAAEPIVNTSIPKDVHTLHFSAEEAAAFLVARPDVQSMCLVLCAATDCNHRVADVVCSRCGRAWGDDYCYPHSVKFHKQPDLDYSEPGKIKTLECRECQ